jgi:hypothetical protein
VRVDATAESVGRFARGEFARAHFGRDFGRRKVYQVHK